MRATPLAAAAPAIATSGAVVLRRGCGARFVAGAPFGLRRRRRAAEDVGAGFFVAADFEQATRLRRVEQVAKGAEAEVAFVEIGPPAFDRLLEHRGPDAAAVAAFDDQRVEGRRRQFDGLAAPRLKFFGRTLGERRISLRVAPHRTALALAHQVVVEDELVAVGDQEIGSRLLDADADHVLGVLAQLGDER